MVYPDLSAPESVANTNSQVQYPLAKPLERTAAFILDFLIFYPVIGFLLAGLSQQIKRIFLVSPNSSEGLTAFALLLIAATVLVVLFQTLFLLAFKATPGMLFMQLRMRDFHDSEKPLGFYQCFLRSFVWVVSSLFAGIPFLEIFGHPYRRHVADRASDTFVITLKKDYDLGPTIPQMALMQSWMKLFIVIGLFNGMLLYTSAYKSFVKKTNAPNSLSSEVVLDESCLVEDKDSKYSNLDRAITLYLVDGLNSECLGYEADVVLWGNALENSHLAYFAKFLVSESKDKEQYLEKVCTDDAQAVCAMMKFMLNPAMAKLGALKSTPEWSTFKYLLSESEYISGHYLASVDHLRELMTEKDFERALDRRYTRGVWALQTQKNDGRQPANDVQSVVDEFKERFEIP